MSPTIHACLDLARFGQLYLDGGRVDGEQILPRSYVEASVGRPGSELNAAYGYLWWLNRSGVLRGPADPVDEAGQPLTTRTGQLAPGQHARFLVDLSKLVCFDAKTEALIA